MNKADDHFLDFPSEEEINLLPEDGGEKFNRLIFEKSPYLLQHAKNPVDWYPWGEAAFKKAKEKDLPVFLSIGYSTCHWCHVMERESFEDREVAKILNQSYIAIKVDKEERPDIDQFFMKVCQVMTGTGGWPLSIFLTPVKQPFYAGTYFPKDNYPQRIGLVELLSQIDSLWVKNRQKLLANASQIIEHLESSNHFDLQNKVDHSIFNTVFQQFRNNFDHENGGFGSKPKFPTAHNLSFLLKYWFHAKEKNALIMVSKTLEKMRLGGIYDHIGFGFHRYSTDQQWKLPHFEKMLYDQAMNSVAYLQVYQITGNDFYKRTAIEVFEYVLRELSSSEGGFFSAEDADSEGQEGLFYLWGKDEVDTLLSSKKYLPIRLFLNLQAEGNYIDEASQKNSNLNLICFTQPLEKYAQENGYHKETIQLLWKEARDLLFEYRQNRTHPFKDQKILCDWNGLMLSAFAIGARILKEKKFLEIAKKCANFILNYLRDHQGFLLKRSIQGSSGFDAHIDDYAFVVWGLLELYQTCFEVKYLVEAIKLNQVLIDYFWDQENGGFFYSSSKQQELLMRNKEIFDGAIPSGNSIAACNLMKLFRMTGNQSYKEKAMSTINFFAGEIKRFPMGHTLLISALMDDYLPALDVVIVGEKDDPQTEEMIESFNKNFLPNLTIILKTSGNTEKIKKISPYTKDMVQVNDQPTCYICEEFSCHEPKTDVHEICQFLNSNGVIAS